MKKVKIVIGAMFGDEGKGITTDYLCSEAEGSKIVIRFSGGHQAGHTVIRNGIKHIHSTYGSGSLQGVRTYLSEHCCFYLPAMKEELSHLQQKRKIIPELFIHPLAMVTTPYDIAWNRVQESKLGHGSVGLGIAATMKRNLTTGYKLYATDLKFPEVVFPKLTSIDAYYHNLLKGDQISLIKYNEIVIAEMPSFAELVSLGGFMYKVQDYSKLMNYENLIFEGSQGILLDMDHGFFPNVTYANTTSKNVFDIIRKVNKFLKQTKHELIHRSDIDIYYITRCYQTRHGNGWMSNENPVLLINNEEEINVNHEWQGKFRVGELDYELLNHSLSVDNIYSTDNTRKHLVVTCLDQRPGFQFDYSNISTSLTSVIESRSPDASNIISLTKNRTQILKILNNDNN